jgi:hypothetical protein
VLSRRTTMPETTTRQVDAPISSPDPHVDSSQPDTVPIEPTPPLPLAVHDTPNNRQANTEGSAVAQPEEETLDSLDARRNSAGGEDRQHDEDPDDEGTQDEADDLTDDPADMSSWAGQPAVKGSSEAMRMILLTFSSIGMTCVSPPDSNSLPSADSPFAASPGEWK